MILEVSKLKILFLIQIQSSLWIMVNTGTNQCLCLPKADLNAKNSAKLPLCFRLLKFVVFNSIQLEKIVTANAVNRVTLIPTFLTHVWIAEILP